MAREKLMMEERGEVLHEKCPGMSESKGLTFDRSQGKSSMFQEEV